jgi:hypothetical protein
VYTYWIIVLVLVALLAHWIIHKFRQLKYRVRQLETELFLYIEYYGKERQEKRSKETGESKPKKER